MAAEQISTRCCIVGGGPCGLMLGFLLARAGVDIVVLEKHADFLRDFRGDTIHPSTLEVMGELGLLDEFLKLPHQKAATISAFFGGQEYAFADFRQLPTRCKYIALMPQWDFLNFLAEQGKRLSVRSTCACATEAVELIEEGGRVAGVRANTPDGSAGNSRRSRRSAATAAIRPCASAPDLKRRGPRRADGRALVPAAEASPTIHGETMGRFDAGRIVMLIDRGDYWQCAFLIPRARSRKPNAPGCRRSGRASRGRCRRSRTGSTISRTGTRSSCSPSRSTGSSAGTGRGCCASATPRTRCRPSAASASISRCRTRWRRRISCGSRSRPER